MLGKKAAVIVVSLAAALSLAVPASADFWGGFFGPGPERGPRPGPGAPPSFQYGFGFEPEAARPARRRHEFVVVRRPKFSVAQHIPRKRRYAALKPGMTMDAGKAVALTPDEVKKDPTLQRGDAVVGKDGVEVYVGGRSADGFVSVAEYRRIDKRLGARLSAYFKRPKVQPNQFLALSAPAPRSSGRYITDANGKKIRVVDGYDPPSRPGRRTEKGSK